MTSSPWPPGLLTALVTPLQDDAINVQALEALIDRQIRAGVAGLVFGGGTGEFGALLLDERRELAREAIRIVNGRVAVIVQTGALATRDVIALSQDAQEAGATGLLVASPFGEPINWRERLRFYEQVDASVSLPIMIYNTPPSGILTLAQIQKLAELSNISAIKDSSGSAELMGDLLAWAATSGLSVYVGMDSLLYQAVGSGARGGIFGAASVIPEVLAQMIGDLQASGSTKGSLGRWHHLRPLLRFMERSPNYIALCKAGCSLEGIDVGEARAPYLMPTSEEVAELEMRVKKVRQAFEVASR